ncbi:phosphatase PAP2 family protein [Chitinilyticum piscinae]|uniref:Phosphatase PAP2 family protein n=1 Tax=Chitinilyticum piscinae TaxID=2866724 RepID=A0A8J7FYB7_9NEIS|nr:phosphatase PAP2 family protein [Chitinilyticum piscinae]MBE9607958.1 phosphatase PAP2 family protein [Chitinilyticum piscinae]
MPHAALTRGQFLRWQAGGLCVAAVLLVLVNYATDWDVRLTDYYYDFAQQRFPWRDAWLTAELGHHWFKLLFQILGVALVVGSIWQIRKHKTTGIAGKRGLVIGLSVILVPGIIATLKHFSSLHCPWEIDRWGGHAPLLRLFDALPSGTSPGQCFPAGHATSALWLLGLIACWLPDRPRRALAMTPLLLAPGMMLGWLQQMRGAHLLSHTLWSVWLSWAIVAALSAWLLFPSTIKETHHEPHQDLGSAGAHPALESGAVRAGQFSQ